MGRWPELAKRIRQRIGELGYKNPAQFADAKGYRITYVYKWAGGVTPDRTTLERLARDLCVTPEWLLFGDVVYDRNRRRPKLSGGSGQDGTPPVDPTNPTGGIMSRLAKAPSRCKGCGRRSTPRRAA